ncbi:MAG: hypothetical protein RLY70_3369, partial [Planctomycetota bacterium]
MAKEPIEDDLRQMIHDKRVVVVVGAGVSCATTSRAPSWRGLIESGMERCRVLGANEEWCKKIGSFLADSDPDMLLAAAELVAKRLWKGGESEFARWLRDTFEKLSVERPEVIQRLVALDLPLVTTNYDDLIEKVAGLRSVTWKEPRKVTRSLRGDDRRVLHLHGHWDEPDSVVLGIRSYEDVKNNEHTQAVM